MLDLEQEVMKMPQHAAEKKQQLKQIDCGPKCGFLVRSHDEKELIEITKKHAKQFHGMAMTEQEIKKDIENVKG
jgi:predicted small metal-binding protein